MGGNALSGNVLGPGISAVLTTAGDLLFVNAAGELVRLPIGAADEVLTVIAGLPDWEAPIGGGGWQTLGDAASIAWDLSLGNAQVTLGGNRTLANPTGGVAGNNYWLKVIQDAVGGRTLAWGNAFRWNVGVVPVVSAAVSAVDLFEFFYDGTYMYAQREIRAAAAEYLPPSVSNLKLWLRADSITGLVDGDTVASWVDDSGQGNTATKTVAAEKPKWYSNILNTHAVVRFDAADDGMITPLSVALPFTVFVVFKCTTTASANRRAVQGSVNWLIGPYAGKNQYYNGAFIDGGVFVANQFYYHCVRCAAGNNNYRLNGVSKGTNANNGAPAVFGLACSGAAAEPLSGDIAEVIVYNKQLDAAETAGIETYLANKYGL